MPLCKCHYHIFWMAPFLISYFFVLSFYIEIKWLIRNLATILPFKSKLSGTFQRFNAIDRSIEMLKNSWIFKNFNWNEKLYLQYQEIYRDIQTFAFKVLQECSFCASRNGAVQIFFLTQNRNMFAGKFVKSERLLAVLREHIIFSVRWVKVWKMNEVFLRETVL